MEDLKKIQEFFSKPLNENKVTKEDFDKVVKILSKSKYPFTIMLVPKWDEIDIITGQDSPDEISDDISQRLDSAGLNWGGNSGITISGDSSNYSRREYSDIFKVNGGHKDYYEESVNEMDINDPVMMKMRAAKDKLAKMRAANAGDDGNDKFFDNAKKIAFLKKEREQLMRDMEQEAEPEGGPIADEYGSKLNRIDKAIAKLQGRKEMTYDQAIAENALGFNDSRLSSDQHTDLDYAVRDDKRYTFGNDPYADDQLRYEYAKKMGFLEEKKEGKSLGEGESKMPTQDQVDRFFELTQNETHYLNSKPVAGQEKTFNKMEVEPWDEYDLSNWNSLVRKAKAKGKSLDEVKVDYDFSEKELIRVLRQLKRGASTEIDMIKAFTKALGRNITKDELFSESIDEASRARVSMPRFVKDKNNPNFLNVYIDYDLGPGGASIALGKETMTGQIRRESAAEAMRLASDVARDLEAEYDLEDIDIQDLKNGKVRIFAVSDDFINMNPNMLGEASKGAMNYFSDLKFNYQKAFRYLDVEEREEYKQLAKDFFSKLQVDNKVRAVGLEEAVNPEVHRLVNAFVRKMADRYDYPLQDAVYAILAVLRSQNYLGLDEATEEEENEFHKNLDKLVHKTFGHSSDEKKKSIAQELAETIKLGEGVIEEELCPKGKAYIKRRQAAGEKSSAYLSGRAVKVCKGQMSGRAKKK